MANHWKLIRNLQQYAIVLSCCRIPNSTPASSKFANNFHNRITIINHFKLQSRSVAVAAGGGGRTRMADALSQVADVDIDGNGTFKYILIRVYGPDTGDDATTDPPSKLIVRGYQRASYHVDIYEEVQAKQLKPAGLDECECEGGGRIKHDRDDKRLLVYGYSQGFGRANHQLAVDLLKVKYPDYEVTWTNDGY